MQTQELVTTCYPVQIDSSQTARIFLLIQLSITANLPSVIIYLKMATLRKVTLTHKDGIAGNKIDENPPKRKNVILKPSVIPAEIDPSLESEPKKLKLDIKPLNSKLLTHKNVKLKIPEDKIIPSEDDHLKSSEYVQHVNLTPKIFGNTQGKSKNNFIIFYLKRRL